MTRETFPETLKKITQLLEDEFKPIFLQIEDDSSRHKGHSAAKEHGGGHLNAVIVSEKFSQLSLMQQHRAVYAVMQPFLKQSVHAFALKTYSPSEWEKKS